MRNLFQFIIRNIAWLVAVILIALSLYFVFTQNSYQRSAYLSSANHVTGKMYEASNQITSFFYLRKNNNALLERQAELMEEIAILKEQVYNAYDDTTAIEILANNKSDSLRFDFIAANVINISLSGVNNFITIDKGTQDGISADMGVVSHHGIVGVVHKASKNYATVIPIINPHFRLSARLLHSDNTGSLSWNGRNMTIAQLGELPRHETFKVGDTIVTSFSRIFPKDIVIGFVNEQVHSKDDNFILLDMKIATDFHALTGVLVIDDRHTEEMFKLENTEM